MAYADAILAESSLVSYWQLNETTGTNAADSKGSNNGTYTGGYTLDSTAYTSSLVKAITLNGSTGYVDIPMISISGSISVECWVKYSSASQSAMLVMKEPVNTQWQLFMDTSKIFWRTTQASGSAQIFATAPSVNVWHHLLATQSGTTANIYIDGVLASTGTVLAIGNGTNTTNNHLSIGRYNTSFYYNGLIDEVAIYNAALTQSNLDSHRTISALGTNPAIRCTQLFADVLQTPNPFIRVTQTYGEVLQSLSPNALVTQSYIEVLQTSTNWPIHLFLSGELLGGMSGDKNFSGGV